MSKFKAGQTIPEKFVLKNAAGAAVQQTGLPTFMRTDRAGACDSNAGLENPEPVSPPVVGAERSGLPARTAAGPSPDPGDPLDDFLEHHA
jgi:hypothetical protein